VCFSALKFGCLFCFNPNFSIGKTYEYPNFCGWFRLNPALNPALNPHQVTGFHRDFTKIWIFPKLGSPNHPHETIWSLKPLVFGQFPHFKRPPLRCLSVYPTKPVFSAKGHVEDLMDSAAKGLLDTSSQILESQPWHCSKPVWKPWPVYSTCKKWWCSIAMLINHINPRVRVFYLSYVYV